MDINVNVNFSAEPEFAKTLESIAQSVAAISIITLNERDRVRQASTPAPVPSAKVTPIKAETKAPAPEPAPEPMPEPTPEPAPKPKKPRKAKKEDPTPEPVAESPVEEEPAEEEPTPEPTPEVSRDEVVALGKELVKKGKGAEILQLMQNGYNVSKFSELKADQLPDVYSDLRRIEAHG